LIGDADGSDVRGFQSAIFKGFPTTLQAGVPDILSVMLDPAVIGEMLRKVCCPVLMRVPSLENMIARLLVVPWSIASRYWLMSAVPLLLAWYYTS
jgi:hypothetical protein